LPWLDIAIRKGENHNKSANGLRMVNH